jgi:hypothetical protein
MLTVTKSCMSAVGVCTFAGNPHAIICKVAQSNTRSDAVLGVYDRAELGSIQSTLLSYLYYSHGNSHCICANTNTVSNFICVLHYATVVSITVLRSLLA